MIRWVADNWLLVSVAGVFAAAMAHGVAGSVIATLVETDAHESHSSFSQHPHQHPHRNGAEGANGVGVDQVHAQRGNL